MKQEQRDYKIIITISCLVAIFVIGADYLFANGNLPKIIIPRTERTDYYFYWINCNEESKGGKIEKKNNIYFIKLKLILISQYIHSKPDTYNKVESSFYSYKDKVVKQKKKIKTQIPLAENITNSLSICKEFAYQKKHFNNSLNFLDILILSKNENKLKPLQSTTIIIGKQKFGNSILNDIMFDRISDVKSLNFNLLELNSYGNRTPIKLSSLCLDSSDNIYFSVENGLCDDLKNEYLGRRKIAGTREVKEIPNNKSEEFSQTEFSGMKMVESGGYQKNKGTNESFNNTENVETNHTGKLTKSHLSSLYKKENILEHPNLGFVKYNDTLRNIPSSLNKVKYLGILNKNIWKIHFSPVILDNNTSNIHFNNPDSKHKDKQIYLLFDEAMELIGTYEKNKFSNLSKKRSRNVLRSTILYNLKNDKTNILTLLKDYNTQINKFFNEDTTDIEAFINKFKRFSIKATRLPDTNYSGIIDPNGEYILDKKFYFLKIGPSWVLKNYQNDKATIPLILPKMKNTKIDDTFSTFWGEKIIYVKYKLFNENRYIFHIFSDSINVEERLFVYSNLTENKLKNGTKFRPSNLWIVFDTYDNNVTLNNFRRSKIEFQKLLNKDKNLKLSTLTGSLLMVKKKNSKLNETTGSRADFIKAFTDYQEEISNNSKMWEMHVLINASSEGANFDHSKKRQIEIMANNMQKLNIIRIYFWEFDSSPDSSSFYKGLATELNSTQIKARHQFITNSKDFNKPFQFSKINFK
jgi:hypothetical protein